MSDDSRKPNVPAGPPPGAPAGPPPGVPTGPPPGPDPISGALNVSAFGQEYAKVILSGQRKQLALWFMDIHNFRSINPKFGFARGNEVLTIVAHCIRKHLSHDLPVARLGGDRFIALTCDMDFEQATEEFEGLITCIEENVRNAGIGQPMVLAAGVYYLREKDYHNPSNQQAIDYASIAHRNARENPKSNLMQFTDEDLERDRRRIAIEQCIDEALLDGQISVWYQPQVDYTYGEIIGAEALARWHHPTLGWISPAEFIPVLENCGKVHALDLFVWEEACRSAGRWRNKADGKPVPISVNVSRTEMFELGLLEHFLELQQKYDLPVGSLHLEVTESAFVEEADRLYKVIERMRKHHVPVEMDDFGSGLSSLNMLKDVPVDVVKLDIGFLRSAMSEDRGGVVLGSVIRMLQGLDTPIIAEGVETLEQAEMLKNMGCHLMQGFHFSRPMPLDEFESFITTNRAVEHAAKRDRIDSHLEELMSIDSSSSFLFNHAIGGMLYFFAGEGITESILVNDQFYEECGFDRKEFGNSKINPIAEIDQESRSTLWRAAAESREYGSAFCHAKVRRTGRWLDCVMRFLGPSSRGDVYSINIVRSGQDMRGDVRIKQTTQDIAWDVDMLNSIVPHGFLKCRVNDALDINYMSPDIYQHAGLSELEFIRRFHNSFAEVILMEDRADFMEAVLESKKTDKTFSTDVSVHYGYGPKHRDVHVIGRVKRDRDGDSWLYLLAMITSEVLSDNGSQIQTESSRTITFDYDFDQDVLTIRSRPLGGARQNVVLDQWAKRLDQMPDTISKASAAKVLATIRDLRNHPSPGYCDLKCNLRDGDDGLRWYHVNYTCDVDEQGQVTVLHGYAQDANDQMGSARWWRQQAEIDQLTGLLNRNAVEQNVNLAIRTQGTGMMFMIDLDGFKRINDELGHLVGDALLRDVSEALAGQFRETDTLGRYGGDEFVAFMSLLGGDPHDVARRRAQSIIDAVSAVTASDGTHAACSVGVVISRSREATFYDLLEVADEAMYHSKEQGKGTHTILES
ncbi:MAG: EAL domain-containing protein [Coriobacteriales bacterium]|nr:EAL domain-containing protein [Coriobacteriales bacterium]